MSHFRSVKHAVIVSSVFLSLAIPQAVAQSSLIWGVGLWGQDVWASAVLNDSDGDGVPDDGDAFPNDPAASLDTDGDGMPDEWNPDATQEQIDVSLLTLDTDDDNDGVRDGVDAFPLDYTEWRDNDFDGLGDNGDFDDDDDGISDTLDQFPYHNVTEMLLPFDPKEFSFGLIPIDSSLISDPAVSNGYSLHSAIAVSADGTYLQSGDTFTGATKLRGDVVSVGRAARFIPRDSALIDYSGPRDNWQNFDWAAWQNVNLRAIKVLHREHITLGLVETHADYSVLLKVKIVEIYAPPNASWAEYVMDTDKPVEIRIGRPEKYKILNNTMEIGDFSESDFSEKTIAISNVNTQQSQFFEDLKYAEPFELNYCSRSICADNLTFYSDGSGVTEIFDRGFTWSIDDSGALRVQFSEDDTTLHIRLIETKDETKTVLVTHDSNEYWSSQLSFLVEDRLNNDYDLTAFLDTPLALGFSLTESQVFTPTYNANGDPVDGIRMLLRADGTGEYQHVATYEEQNELGANLAGIVFRYPLSWMLTDNGFAAAQYLQCEEVSWDGVFQIVGDPGGAPNQCSYRRTRDVNILDATSEKIYIFYTLTQEVFDGERWIPVAGSLSISNFSYLLKRPFNFNDSDLDGVLNEIDIFPIDPNESVDTDGDRIGDNADPDADNDGLLDENDTYPLVSVGALLDSDGDGAPDECDLDCQLLGMQADPDDDNDGVADERELADGTDPLDSTDFIAPDPELSGRVYHWSNHALLAGVDVLRSSSSGESNVITGADGVYTFSETPAGSNELSVTRPVSEQDFNRTITSADALAALKIAVGLNPNADPDGDGPLQPLPVSPYQLIAADINRDGRVSSSDALSILKLAVGLSGEAPPAWAFVEDSLALWESHNSRSAVFDATASHQLNYPAEYQANFAAILVGDVNGSWQAPADASALDESYFTEKSVNSGAPLFPWGLRDSDGDGLTDAQEAALGTNLYSDDSDGDGVSDARDAFPLDSSRFEDVLSNAGWELVWSDEFDGDSLDSTTWEAQLGEGAEFGLTRWGNNEQQWYLAENATVADGMLTITAKSEEVQPGFPYTSARLRTAGKFDFKYGRVEVRGKAAAGQGLWSAVWMLPTESPYGTWASSGEVDIMEVVNAGTESERVFTTVHHGFPWPLNQLSGLDVPVDGAADDFHTYALEWEEDELRWFIDGVHVKTVGAEHYYSYYYKDTSTGYESGPATAPFDTEFHLLVNLAVGGNLPGNVNAGDIPSEMVIDYIRVYNCSYNQADGGGCNSNADRTLERPDAQEPFEASFPMYTDAAKAFSWVVGGEEVVQQLAVNSFWNNEGALSFMESEVDGRGTVIEVMTSNMGNISINTTDGSTVTLFGFGNNPNFWEIHAGEIKFDMYIDSAGTDLDSSILIKMDSGYPALGVKELKVADLPKDEWFTYSVMINDLLANAGDAPLDTSKVNSLFVLEPTSAAHVMVDNIELACGHPSQDGCGIAYPEGRASTAIPVFENGEVNTVLWNRGACGYDTTVNGDYCDDGNTNNLITWTVTDSGDPGIGNALLVNFGTNGANGVFFFGSAGGVDISEFEAQGKLRFDLRLPAETVAAGMVYKVDCFFPCGTGDQQLDLTGYEPGTWKTFEVSVSDLKSLGLDLTRVNALVFFPTWGSQQGLSFEVANVRYEVPGGELYAGTGGTEYGPADFSGAFGGVFVDASETYTFPSGAEDWGGFANNNGEMYPMEFPNGGKVTFTAAIPETGLDTNVRFVFENAPFPDIDPNFSTANVLVSGGEATYEVEIPSQPAGQTFSSMLMYIVERDQPVTIKNVRVLASQ